MEFKQVISFLLLVWNLLVFITYGIDKYKARKGHYRISEATLLWMAYLGGGVGAWAGGTRFHHKTQKAAFRRAWFVGLLVDGLLLYWFTH